MAEINHRVGIKAKPEKIYQALTTDSGLAAWWTTDTSGAGEVGSMIKFCFNDQALEFVVTELITNNLVRWQHAGTEPEAWTETEILFQLQDGGEQTFVRFTHSNWKEPSDFMAHCSTKWAVFLLSLKDVMETGKGKPFPHDTQIDHS